MKIVFVIFLLVYSLSACTTIRPNRIPSLSVPEDGFKLVRHTPNVEERHNNALYLPSRKIERNEFNSENLKHFIQQLRMAMHNWKGVGIAANQVNKNIQLFLIEAKHTSLWHETLDIVPYQVFINPKITRVSQERRNFWHGCLSANGEKLGNLASYEWIEYEAYDAKGELHSGRLTGFASVIFQHELRHLMGGTYLDKANQFIDTREFFAKINEQKIPFFEEADDSLPLLLDDYIINETLEDYYLRIQ